jgi:hypothetical protein
MVCGCGRITSNILLGGYENQHAKIQQKLTDVHIAALFEQL